MKGIIVLAVGLIVALSGMCQSKMVYNTDELIISKITDHCFVHTSYLEIENYGSFPCNGLVYSQNGEAVVFDTPITDSVSTALINWIEDSLNSEIKGVFVNHFHIDCLGGLAAFHEKKIPSYANILTLELAKQKDNIKPKNGFESFYTINVGGEVIVNRFMGEAHTSDNIISYIPSENLLFGGCMVKEVGAGKGNLEDANLEEWPNTISKIKETYPDLEYIVPGHGAVGGTELLDYTIKLFSEKF